MAILKGLTDLTSSEIEDIAAKILLWVGIVFLLIGFTGVLLLIMFPTMYGSDQAMQFSTSFIYSYMTVIGIFLVLYHGKIIVKGYRT